MSNTHSPIPSTKRHSTQELVLEREARCQISRGQGLHCIHRCLLLYDAWWGGNSNPSIGAGLSFCMQIWPPGRVNWLHSLGGGLCFLYLVSLQSEGREHMDRAACVHNLMLYGAVMNCVVGLCLQVNCAVINHSVDFAHKQCFVFSSRWAQCQDCPLVPAFTISTLTQKQSKLKACSNGTTPPQGQSQVGLQWFGSCCQCKCFLVLFFLCLL